jgi:hypothetical protein
MKRNRNGGEGGEGGAGGGKLEKKRSGEGVVVAEGRELDVKKKRKTSPSPTPSPSRPRNSSARGPRQPQVSNGISRTASTASTAEVNSSSKKKKKNKPKHLQRKLAQALAQEDSAAIIEEITTQQVELDSLKAENAKKWKETCQKIAGPEKWDEAKFDQLVGIGMEKKKLMEALGIDASKEKKKNKPSPAKSKTMKPNKSRQGQGDTRKGKPQTQTKRSSNASKTNKPKDGSRPVSVSNIPTA